MIKATKEDWEAGISLRYKTSKGMAKPLEIEPYTRGQYSEPFLRLDTTEAQQLMDELWGCGIRPSEGSGSVGSLRATEHHLKDMQTIAFKLLGEQ